MAFLTPANRLKQNGRKWVNINEIGRFDLLKGCVDKTKAKAYFEGLKGESISVFKVNIKVDMLLQKFIFQGGFDLESKW